MKKKVIVIVIAAAAIAGVIAIVGANMFREINEEKQINLTGIDEIQVTVSSAAIHIIRTETGNEVRFHYYGKSLQEVKLISKTINQTLTVNTERKYAFLGTAEVTSLDIYIPQEYRRNIAIKTSSGHVKMDSLILAGLTLKTNSGGFEADKVQAAKSILSTTSGKISIGTLYADELDIKGASSSISIAESIVRKAGIKTTSGSISMTCQKLENTNLNIENTSGGITLRLPGTAEFLLKAGNTSGKIQCDFQVNSMGDAGSHKLEGQVGVKNNTISLRASSGNIRILKNDR